MHESQEKNYDTGLHKLDCSVDSILAMKCGVAEADSTGRDRMHCVQSKAQKRNSSEYPVKQWGDTKKVCMGSRDSAAFKVESVGWKEGVDWTQGHEKEC